ncbi:MAG: sensor histidine kinase [Leptolyngbya foveolarum]|uniref:histidine kinase n=1 Tax=Leptolyngbya foveolarum TaxID=47253 RepID=A0A2W4W4H9_9CYAN|nr:MAG: sensor histidine kinase [Leptolyngbya foveolarum]
MKSVVDPKSIQFRLTLGLVLVSALGIGGFTSWINLRMRELLVDRHKANALMIASRLSEDASWFEESTGMNEALTKAVNYREQADVAVWVNDPNGRRLVESKTLGMGSWAMNGFSDEVLDLVDGTTGLETVKVQNRYLVTCSSPLTVNGEKVGGLYVVDDITADHESLSRITQTLVLSSLLLLGLVAIAIALYTKNALAPIRKINRLAGEISADNLADTQLEFDRAPTEVQELAQTCNLMISRLSSAWDQQKRFVSDVSHELRTPLTLVNGYLQSTLRRGDNLSAPQREGLEIASAEAERTIHLLQELLDLARAEGGHLQFHLELESVDAVVREVMEMSQYGGDFPRGRLGQRLQVDLVPVNAWIDRNKLKQVLINLVDNALKYSEADQPVVVSLRERDGRSQIAVKDTGRGIPLSDLTKIFEPFYRVDECRSRVTGGTGLGLAIVKTLVTGMGGSLEVRSKLDEGSVFTVSLPTKRIKKERL